MNNKLVVTLLALLFVATACSSSTSSSNSTSSSGQPASSPTIGSIPKLPGQQVWKQNVSSFLFGTNDTQEWATNNVETSTAIQQSLKAAHMTLMRTFFFDKSLADGHATTDTEIEQRLTTIENSGMTCLGVLDNIYNAAFNEHVVTYAGNRCLLYEFGNEADMANVSIDAYLAQWNAQIPRLRQINPQAKFIGPVTYNKEGNHGFMRNFLVGVKASGILPDAVSFHWYPCYYDSESACMAHANEAKQAVLDVRSLVRSILGRELPVGISEWNFDPGNPPPSYGDNASFMTQFTTLALVAMAQAGTAFACQFDAASYSGYGRLDMFDVDNNQPKPQFLTIQKLIQSYRP